MVTRAKHWYDKINAGHVLTIVTMLSGLFITYTALVGKWTNIVNAQTDLTKSITTLAIKVDDMDLHGTHFNRESMATDTVVAKTSNDRIAALEVSINKAVPDIATIRTNLGWIMAAMREDREARGMRNDPVPIPPPTNKD